MNAELEGLLKAFDAFMQAGESDAERLEILYESRLEDTLLRHQGLSKESLHRTGTLADCGQRRAKSGVGPAEMIQGLSKKWVERATRPLRSVTRRPEWERLPKRNGCQNWLRRPRRSVRRVAGRYRLVACATQNRLFKQALSRNPSLGIMPVPAVQLFCLATCARSSSCRRPFRIRCCPCRISRRRPPASAPTNHPACFPSFPVC